MLGERAWNGCGLQEERADARRWRATFAGLWIAPGLRPCEDNGGRIGLDLLLFSSFIYFPNSKSKSLGSIIPLISYRHLQ